MAINGFDNARLLAAKQLVIGIKKKFNGVSSDSSISDAESRCNGAILEFLEDNHSCKKYNLAYPNNLSHMGQVYRGELRNLMHSKLANVVSLSSLASQLRAGPGASSHVDTDAGSFSRLSNGPMSFSSPEVKSLYRILTSSSPLSYATELARNRLWGKDDNLSSYACFISVPKTYDVDRGISTHPSGNMACCLALHNLLAENLKKRFSIDLANQQEINRKLALIGSKGSIGGEVRPWSFCTIDMTRASNFPLSWAEDVTPSDVFSLMSLLRSPTVEFKPKGTESFSVKKQMLSTMGNGFTFAFMTTLFAALVEVIYTLSGLPLFDNFKDPETGELRRFKTYAVFGDDIICDKSVYNIIVEAFSEFNCKVNAKKSYSSGFFRESCGGDYLDGYDVRPVFCENLEKTTDIYSLLNRLSDWAFKHSFKVPKTLSLLREEAKKVNNGVEFRIPPEESDVCMGIRVPLQFRLPYNTSEMKHYFAKILSKEGFSYSSDDIKQFNGCLYTGFLPRLISRLVYRDKYKWVEYSTLDRTLRKYRLYSETVIVSDINLYGVIQHMISGDVSGGKYGRRPDLGRNYTKGSKYSPSWGSAYCFSGTHATLRSGAANAVRAQWELHMGTWLKPSVQG